MSRRRAATAGLLALLLALLPAVAGAAAERPASEVEAARAYFTDVELVDQNGETQRLYSDLMEGKVVVVSSMFTTCAAVCPLIGQKMKRLQEAAGERLGRDVLLLSITVDPRTDTPARLHAWGERFDAREGWYLLTGSPENVGQALAKLGFAVEERDDHSTVVLMGNERTGLWKKTNGLASSDALVELFEGVLADTRPASAAAAGGRR